MPSTVRDVVFRFLRSQGMTTVFGNPGSTELPMLTDFPADFRYVLGLQEAGVVSMADGWAQATGLPTLVNLHTAPGVGNAMGALVTAQANGAPLVVTAGQQVRAMIGLEALLTNPRSDELPRPVVKFATEPARAQDVPAVIARATHLAMTPPRGPVFVSIPMDDWDAPADDEAMAVVTARRVHARAAPDPLGIELLVSGLAAARTPALIIGSDVDATGGFADGVALAERLQADVFAPPAAGRLGFPQSHALFRGALPWSIRSAAAALAPYDLVLVFGAPVFRYYPYEPGRFLAGNTRLLHVTASADEAARAPVGDAVVADPTLTLRALVERVERRSPVGVRPEPGLSAAAPSGAVPAGALSADEVFAAVAATWPEDGILVFEAPSHLPVAQARLRLDRTSSFFLSASGGLGFGLPAAVGIGLADPTRPVLLAIGDGSLQYSVQALATAAATGVPLVVLVLDNGGYSILKWFAEREETPGVPGLDLPPIDHLALARAYGVPAESVSTTEGLTTALTRAYAAGGPRLIHVTLPRR